jgi:hypothetical protein
MPSFGGNSIAPHRPPPETFRPVASCFPAANADLANADSVPFGSSFPALNGNGSGSRPSNNNARLPPLSAVVSAAAFRRGGGCGTGRERSTPGSTVRAQDVGDGAEGRMCVWRECRMKWECDAPQSRWTRSSLLWAVRTCAPAVIILKYAYCLFCILIK